MPLGGERYDAPTYGDGGCGPLKPVLIAGGLVTLVFGYLALLCLKNDSGSQSYTANAAAPYAAAPYSAAPAPSWPAPAPSWPAPAPSWQAAGAGAPYAAAPSPSWPAPQVTYQNAGAGRYAAPSAGGGFGVGGAGGYGNSAYAGAPSWPAPAPAASLPDVGGDAGYGNIAAQVREVIQPDPVPTVPLQPGPFPSMFCWMYISSPAEVALTQEIAKMDLSIFRCDEYGVFSGTFADLGNGRATASPLVDIEGTKQMCRTKANTVCNALVFVRVWDAVRQDGRYRRHQWTVKVDADSVFFPERLRPSLAKHTFGRPAAVMPLSCWNTTVWFLGPLEIVSRELIQIYFDRPRLCVDRVDFDTGEDFWMQSCFEALGVDFDKINLDWMLSDNSHTVSWAPPDPCAYQRCSSPIQKVVYHHYKTAGEWQTCHREAAKATQMAKSTQMFR